MPGRRQGYSRSRKSRGSLALGAVVTCALQWLCLALPKWPLHPIGFLVGLTWYAAAAWASLFVGWLLKTLLLRYGGSQLYRKATPVLIGLIMGEVVATAFWALESVLRVILDQPYSVFHVLPA